MTTTSPMPSSPRRRAVLLHLLVGSLTVPVLLCASRFSAAAAPISISQHDFVQVCKDTGGTPTSVATYVVKCTYPNGATSTCNFVTKDCTDTPPTPITSGGNASPISGGDVPIGGGVVFDGPDGTDVTASPDPTQPDAAAPPQPIRGHAHHRHGHRRRA